MVPHKLTKLLACILILAGCPAQFAYASDSVDLEQAQKAVRMQDFDKAQKLYLTLAQQGDAKAQLQLANFYLQGIAVPKSTEKAQFWLTKAAAQGLPEAQFGLAQILKDSSPQKAEDLLKKAASQGHRAAQTHLKRAVPIRNQNDTTPFANQWFGAARNNDTSTLIKLNTSQPSISLEDKSGRTALFYAIETQGMEATQWLIKQKADVNHRDNFGISPLQVTLQRKNIQLFDMLLKSGANPKESLKNGDTLLHYALRLELYNVIRPLVKSGIDLNQLNNDGWTALDVAEYNRAQKTADFLKSQGAKNGDGWRSERRPQNVKAIAKQLSNTNLPPIALAVINSNEALIRKFVADDRSVLDTRLNDDSTLLMLAIKQQKGAMLDTLLELGSNVTAQGYQGVTALQIAVRINDTQSILALLKAGASPIQQNDNERDAIITAIEAGKSSIADLLLDNLIGTTRSKSEIRVHLRSSNVPVNHYILLSAQHGLDDIIDRLLPYSTDTVAVDKRGRNAMWFAAQSGNAKLILKLLKAKIPPDMPDNLGVTPFLIAIDKSCLQCARQLLGFADINHQTTSGNTALMIAIANKNVNLSAWLIQNKADIEIRNKRGNTAIMRAVNANSFEIVKLLLKADANVTRKNKLGFSAIDLAKNTSPEMLELVKSKSVLGLF